MQRCCFLLLIAILLVPQAATAQSQGPYVTIGEIQGAGEASPFAGEQMTRPLRGCVTGVTAEGFFLQAPAGDGNPATSDGVYVYRFSSWRNPRGLKPGDLVELVGRYKVVEFYGQTEISGLSNDKAQTYRIAGRCPLPAPIPIETPIRLDKPLTDQYEPVEGQRITISFEGSVVGPTQRFESRYPASDPEITLAPLGSPLWNKRIFADTPVDIGTITLTGGLGVDLPAVNTFDHVRAEGLTGILAYQFGRYVFLVDNPHVLQVSPTTLSPATVPAAQPDEWTLCSFNAENLFDAVDDRDGDMGAWAPKDNTAYRAGLARRAAVIRDRLGQCTVLAVQEVEGKDAVWHDLAEALGPSYRYDYRESEDVRDITVGLIYDGSRVELQKSRSSQVCTGTDYGVSYSSALGERADANPCRAGAFPLYDRPPYLADIVVASAAHDRRAEVRLAVVHLKSKRGDEAANAGRRVEQARHVAELLAEGPAAIPMRVALGDFNDDLGSRPLAELQGYINLYERHVSPSDRYSYIYNGRSQAVDHILMTAESDRFYLSGGPVHVNADFAEPLNEASGRVSDHDPVLARFRFGPTGISDGLLGAVGGALGYHQRLRLK